MAQKKIKKIIGLLLGFLLLMAVAWGIFFFYMLNRLQQELNRFQTSLQKEGYSLSYKTIGCSGFLSMFARGIPKESGPLAFLTLHFHEVNLHPLNSKAFSWQEWQGDHVTLDLNPFRLMTIEGQLKGKHTLSFYTLSLEDNHPHQVGKMALEQGSFSLGFGMNFHQIDGFSLRLPKISFYLSEPSKESYTLKNTWISVRHLTNLLTLEFVATTDLILASHIVPHISIMGQLSGFHPKRSFPNSLSQWRDGGGILDITSFVVTNPPLDIRGNGTFTFDEEMLPLASCAIEAEGLGSLLGQMGAFFGDEAKTGTLKTSLRLQKGSLFMGSIPFPIYRFK